MWVAWAQCQADLLDSLTSSVSDVIRMSVSKESDAYTGPSYGNS